MSEKTANAEGRRPVSGDTKTLPSPFRGAFGEAESLDRPKRNDNASVGAA